MVEIRTEQLPARYNTESELTETLKPGEQTIHFPLKSK